MAKTPTLYALNLGPSSEGVFVSTRANAAAINDKKNKRKTKKEGRKKGRKEGGRRKERRKEGRKEGRKLEQCEKLQSPIATKGVADTPGIHSWRCCAVLYWTSGIQSCR